MNETKLISNEEVELWEERYAILSQLDATEIVATLHNGNVLTLEKLSNGDYKGMESSGVVIVIHPKEVNGMSISHIIKVNKKYKRSN